jgi:hypothetical protein
MAGGRFDCVFCGFPAREILPLPPEYLTARATRYRSSPGCGGAKRALVAVLWGRRNHLAPGFGVAQNRAHRVNGNALVNPGPTPVIQRAVTRLTRAKTISG